MKFYFFKIAIVLILISFVQCKENKDEALISKSKIQNEILYAKGFSLFKQNGFSILKVNNPWPKANKNYTYILKEKDGIIPDSLTQFTIIDVPIKTIIVTSTTHIPSLEMLGVENSLVGFPHLDYISSEKIRARIDTKKVKELGDNHDLNTEYIIDLAPSVLIGYGIDNKNPTLDNLEKNGLKVVYNGDWNEESPLGKAEWIKFFGALYGLENKADELFSAIEKDYKKTFEMAKKTNSKPTIMAGAMFEDQWYLPKGNSWGCSFLNDANGNYLWKNTKGTGSLSLSFEKVLENAKNADFWIGPGQFSSLSEMEKTNKHYMQFKAFQDKKIYSFSSRKGKTGGVIFYELAPNRPDLVLKDLVKILHPELLPTYKLTFFEQLK